MLFRSILYATLPAVFVSSLLISTDPFLLMFWAAALYASVRLIETNDVRCWLALGVIVGLVIGKPIGVVGAAWLTARFTRARLSPDIGWRDVTTVGVLAGIGFTVALLITELAYEPEPGLLESAKVAVLTASVLAALLATVAIRGRNRHYAVIHAQESVDVDGDGIPDVYEDESPR